MHDPIVHRLDETTTKVGRARLYVLLGVLALSASVTIFVLYDGRAVEVADAEAPTSVTDTSPPEPEIDKREYDHRLRMLAHISEEAPPVDGSVAEAGEVTEASGPAPWPVDAVYPDYGAILPFHRIVAYYGNFYSRGMGVLGEYDHDVVLEKLAGEVAAWEQADPATPVMPAIDYIAVTAQASAGKDGMYRLRMPASQIEKAIAMAEEIDGIVILEVQPGYAPLMGEIRALEAFLSLPNVHLAIDPEFVMITRGVPPGVAVGTVDATDVNAAAEYLADLVRRHALPPKVLIVHRYTRPMVTNAQDIIPLPEVQMVIDMDGWGPPDKKIASYDSYVASEPVQFTGFKLFYKNDIRREGSRLMRPDEILRLTPAPIFIQYQ